MNNVRFIFKKNYVLIISFVIGLILLLTACEVPTELSLGGGGRNSVQPPHSVFAAAYKFVPVRQAALEDGEVEMRKEYVHLPAQPTFQVAVGHPLHIETYHLSRSSKFGRVDIWVNGQLVRSEQSGGPAAFPDYLAEMQVLGEADGVLSPDFMLLPSSNCQRVGEMGLTRRLNPIELKYPSSTWSLCHTWVGLTPGTYELKMQATDRAGVKGFPVVQRIEVFEAR